MSKRENILDLAEQCARAGGIGALSFRDLAASVGIKSASVHYHFPTKDDLVEALVARYSAELLAGLGDSASLDDGIRDKLSRLTDTYVALYAEGSAPCLCATLSNVAPTLGPKTQTALSAHYRAIFDWLSTALSKSTDDPEVAEMIALLQGALAMAVYLGDPTVLQTAETTILTRVEQQRS